MPFRLLQRLAVFFAALVACVLLFSSSAHAQVAILQSASLPRLNANHEPIRKRDPGLTPEGISYQDCIDNQSIRFALQMASPPANTSVQFWAGLKGTSCSDQQARTSTNHTCWQVSLDARLMVNPVVDVPVRAILAGAGSSSPAKAQEMFQAAQSWPESICGAVDFSNIDVQVLYFAPGEATPSSSAMVTITADTIGPAPPGGIKKLPGNKRINISWDNISGEGGVAQIAGINAYCDVTSGAAPRPSTACEEEPAPSTDVDASEDDDGGEVGDSGESGDGGAVTDAGTCDAGASVSECSSANLPAGEIPDPAKMGRFACGSFGNSGAGATVDKIDGKPLDNGTVYAVSLSATDYFGNVGPLSSPVCEWPEETNDFWEKYRSQGGGAGGGFCNTASPGSPVGSVSALAVVAIAAASMLRKKKKDRR